MSLLQKVRGLRRNKPDRKWFNRFEAVVFLLVFFGYFGYMAHCMGLQNMMNTMMATSHDLLLNTVFFIMGITVLMGAFSRLLAEFNVVELIERILRPFMRPLFNLPGVAALGAVLTFLSDNPAIISLAGNRKFARNFKIYQLVSLTNFGTAWGMGLIVVAFMMAKGYAQPALVGVSGAAIGCIISTRLMQFLTLRAYPEFDAPVPTPQQEEDDQAMIRAEGNGVFMRTLDAALEGGKQGVSLGLAIIPGVLIISTMVMMVTFKTAEFTGGAYEGIGLLPAVADKVSWLFEALFGFQNSELLAFPMTALGAVGAAIGLIPSMQAQGILDGNAVAVFTAIGMCWSGYLSTHAAMLDSMGYRQLISKAILSHTVAGLCAGVVAHWIYVGIGMM